MIVIVDEAYNFISTWYYNAFLQKTDCMPCLPFLRNTFHILYLLGRSKNLADRWEEQKAYDGERKMISST